MLTKGFDIGFKDIDTKKGIVKAQFAVHNIKDLGGDVSEFGSLKKTIDERGPNGKRLIKFCLNHQKTGLPGVFTELWEEPSGGYYVAQAGTHNAGIDFVKMVESGIINQQSYGYRPIKQMFDSAAKVNRLKEIFLMEVSAIEFLGMNPETTYIDLKSESDAMEYLGKLEKFLRTSDATDETLMQIELKLKSLSELVKPGKSTLDQKKADENEIKSLIDLLKS